MGSTWEVTAWVHDDIHGWHEASVCATQWLFVAVMAAIKAKRNSGCVRIVWRG